MAGHNKKEPLSVGPRVEKRPGTQADPETTYGLQLTWPNNSTATDPLESMGAVSELIDPPR
jgi:hypothetical protein